MNHELVHALSALGIETVDDMLKASKTESKRRELAEQTGFDPDGILELSKLSNLTRLGAVKAVRARLYHDAGFDTLEKIASTCKVCTGIWSICAAQQLAEADVLIDSPFDG